MGTNPPRSPDAVDALWAKLFGEVCDYEDTAEGILVVMRRYKGKCYILDMIEM